MTLWTAAFVEAALPDVPALPPADYNAAREHAAAFLVSQCALAPWHLRLALALMRAAFRVFARASHPVRGFSGLDLPGRRRLIARWEGLGGAARAFIRLSRSLALLAFFEHPAVLAALGCPEREGWREGKRRERATRVAVR